jgi:tripartite-type tricarboxylate transporter receptor subunit TctC
MQRRQFIHAGAALGAAALLAGPIGLAQAQGARHADYPVKPVTLIVPYAPGGTGEVLGRALAQRMGELLGQTVVIEMRPGAGGNIGADYVARQARNDGYTFLLGSQSLSTNVSLMKLPFDPRKDLVPVAGIGAIPNLLVTAADGPYKTLADVMAAAKKDPAAITFGSSGPGTGSHLAGELLAAQAGVKFVHVPYKGSGAVYPDLIANRVTLLFDVTGSSVPQVKGGKVKPLAITSKRRSPALPDVVPVAQQGFPNYEFATWFGFFAPAGTPPEIVARLEQATIRSLEAPEVKERLAQIGSEPIPHPAAEFWKYYLADVERWAALVREGKVAPLQ